MKLRFLFVPILLAVSSLSAQTSIPIQNPSFETYNQLQSLACSVGTQSWSSSGIPSWSGGNGTLLPCPDIYTSIPDGVAVAYTTGSAITQNTGVAVTANGSYVLTASTGHRKDNHNQNSSSQSTITLLAGSTPLCSVSISVDSITPGTFQSLSCSYPSPATPPTGNLIVSLSASSGSESDFDLVSLTFTPNNPPPPHQTDLSWQPGPSTPFGTTFNVYRSNGSSWNPQLLANVSGTSYADTTIVLGQNYVYKVTALYNGVESDGPFLSITVDTQ